MPEVKVWQGVALSLNIDPDEVRHQPQSWMAETNLFQEGQEFNDRIEVAQRTVGADVLLRPTSLIEGEPRNWMISVSDFAKWSLLVGWDIPKELIALGDTGAAEKQLSTKERETLLKLIIGMAVAGYRYDVTAPRNEATGEISRDLANLGIALNQDTVRKWLREAAELLPATSRRNLDHKTEFG